MASFAKTQLEKDEKFLRDGGSPLELAVALRQRAETSRREWIRKDWIAKADLAESEQRQLDNSRRADVKFDMVKLVAGSGVWVVNTKVRDQHQSLMAGEIPMADMTDDEIFWLAH
jgi:hypothetical protein